MIVIMTVIGSFGKSKDATMIVIMRVIILIIFMMIVITVIAFIIVIVIVIIISFFHTFQMWHYAPLVCRGYCDDACDDSRVIIVCVIIMISDSAALVMQRMLR